MSKIMEVRSLPNQEGYRRMTTEELRKAFLLENLFVRGDIAMVYCDADRAIVGGAIPTNVSLKLFATKKEMAAEYFTERRELGIANLGGKGMIRAGGVEHALGHKDMLYVGRGVQNVEFVSVNEKEPAVFYFVSFPAHKQYPVALVSSAMAEHSQVGSAEGASRRTIHRYIHKGGAQSCQLVMGLTDLEQGSVWNSFPPHTHQRRMEVYLYFGLDKELAVHLMGTPEETRSLIIRNHQAVISPSWSLHCGVATKSYSFVWAMGGENQEFSDMDSINLDQLL
jgi:4-deoxy-L-threo-5-hexosulose-uronate ketol-isomerase